MSGNPVQKPRFTVNAESPVLQLISCGRSGHVAVLYEGSAAVLSSDGTLVWRSDAQHVAAAQFGSSVAFLEPTGGGTILKTSGSGVAAEDLFLDSVASGDGVGRACGGPLGCLALACGRRLLTVDEQHRVRQDVLLQPGGEPLVMCWAGQHLCCASSRDVQFWQPHDACPAQGLPDSQRASEYTCLAASPSGALLAAGSTDGQVLVWTLGSADDAVGSARLLHKLPHDAAVEDVAWDATSQRLAVSDGATVALWDLSGEGGCATGSGVPAPTVCCGHQRLARITAVAFHESLQMLATGATHGQVLVYDVACAAPGTQLQPVLRATVSQFADCCDCRVSAVAWLSTGALAAGCHDGRVVSWPGAAAGHAPAADTQEQAAPLPSLTKAPAASASAPQLQGQRANGEAYHRRPPAPSSCHAEGNLAAAKRSAAAALAAATQVNGAAAPAPRQGHPPRSGRSLRSASAPQGGGCVAAELAAVQQPGSGGSAGGLLENGAPAAEHANGSAPSPASSQRGGSSATTDEAHVTHALESPVRSVLPLCSADQGPFPPCSAAPVPEAGEAPQPPPTPPSARSSRPRRGNRRGSSSSLADSVGAMHGSNPDFQRRWSSSSNLAVGAAHAQSAPSTPHFPPQNAAMNGHWPQNGAMNGHWPHSGSPAPYGMFVPGCVQQTPPSPTFVSGGMVMPHSPGHPQSPYMMGPPVAYMHPPAASMPVFVHGPMPMNGAWAPYSPAGYLPPGMYQGYPSVPQSPTWHASPPQPYPSGTPPMSPSSTYNDFTPLTNGVASTPSAVTTGNGAGQRSRGGKRSSRARATNGTKVGSPEQPSLEVSSSCSSLQLTNSTEPRSNAVDVAVPVTTVYVGNLPPAVDEHILQTAFQHIGSITACEVVRENMNGESRGFAFLTFAYASCAASAMVNMGGAVLHGPFGDNVLKVGPSTRETQAQMQQVTAQSAARAASAVHLLAPAAAAQPDAAPAADAGEQQPLHVRQDEEQGPETLEQLQNGKPLTAAQQQQMRLSAAKQQFAAEQRQQLVERARQGVAAAEHSGQQTQPGANDASASPDPARQQHPTAAEAIGVSADAPAAGLSPPESAAQLAPELGAAVVLDTQPRAVAEQDFARPAAEAEQA